VLSEVRRLVHSGALDQAVGQLRRAIEGVPDQPQLWVCLGEVQEMAGRRTPAAEAYQRAAQLFSERNSYLQAVAVYKRKLLPLAPEMLSAHVRLAELYHYLGLLDDALEQYLLVARFYEQRQRRPEAARILRRVLDLKPESIPARLRLAELCRADKRADEAAEQFGRVCDLLLSGRKYQDYLKVAERLVFLKPDDLQRTRELITILLEQGNPKRALHHLQRGLQMAPEDPELLELLARTFLDLRQTSKTVQVLEELARLHEKGGNKSKAQQLRRRARELTSGGSGVSSPGGSVPDRAAPPPPPTGPPTGLPVRASRSAAVVAKPTPRAAPSAAGAAGAAPEPARGGEGKRGSGSKGYDPGAGDTRPMSREQFLAGEAKKAAPRSGSGSRRSSADQVERLLHETRVYVKYGLKHKALDHISRVLVHAPENVDALLIRKQLLLQSGERDKAALVLLRLAEITRDDQAQSRAYVEEARKLGAGPLARPGGATAAPRGSKRSVGPAAAASPVAAAAVSDAARRAEMPRRGRTLPPLSASNAALHPGAPALAVADEQITTPLPRMEGDGGPIPSDLLNVRAGKGLIHSGGEAQEGGGTEPEVAVPAQIAPPAPAPAAASPVPPPPAPAAEARPGRVEAVMVAEVMDDGFVFLPELPEDGGLPTLAEPEEAPEVDEDAEADAFLEELTGPGPVPAEFAGPLPPGDDPDEAPTPGDSSEAEVFRPEASEDAGNPPAPPSAEEMADEALREVEFFLEQGLQEEALQTLGDALRLLPETAPLRPRLLELRPRLEQRASAPAEPAPPETPAPEETAAAVPVAPNSDSQGEEPPSASGLSATESADQHPVRPLMNATDAETHYDLGIAYMEMGLSADAIHEFRTAMEADVRRAECHALIGRCYLRSDNPSEAITWLKRGLRVQGLTGPQRLGLLLSLGEAHLAVGDKEEAREYLEEVRKGNPGTPSLERLLRQCGVKP